MNSPVIHAARLALAITYLLAMNTAAQDDPLPRSDAPIKTIKPDRALIERIRGEFEGLPPALDVAYDYKESDSEGGPSFLERSKYLQIKLSGAAHSFAQGKGLVENNLRCETVFALWPYLQTSKDKQAFVLLMAITGEYFGHKIAPGSHMPYASGFDESAWQAKKSELMNHLAGACRFVLEAGAESSFRRKYDLRDLALEKIPSSTTAKPNAEPLDLSPARGTSTSNMPSVKSHQPRKPDEVQSDTSGEPTSSTPWSVIVILIMAAIGLLWLVLKRRS